MSDYNVSFVEVELIWKSMRVTWEWIGEGNEGDYNPDDPEDTPLLRFSCDHYIITDDGDGYWEGMEDASYCTQLPVDTPMRHLVKAAGIIMEAIDTDSSYKRELEHLSWFCPEDFDKPEKKPMAAQPNLTI